MSQIRLTIAIILSCLSAVSWSQLGTPKNEAVYDLIRQGYTVVYDDTSFKLVIMEDDNRKRCYMIFNEAWVCKHVGRDYSAEELYRTTQTLSKQGFINYMETDFFCMGSMKYWMGQEPKVPAVFLANPESPYLVVVILVGGPIDCSSSKPYTGVVFMNTE